MNKKFNFSEMSDFEVMALESQLKMTLETTILAMKLNNQIGIIEEDLESVKEELVKRGINV